MFVEEVLVLVLDKKTLLETHSTPVMRWWYTRYSVAHQQADLMMKRQKRLSKELTSASEECSSLVWVKRDVAIFIAKPKSHRHNDRSDFTRTLRELTSRWTTVGFTMSPTHRHNDRSDFTRTLRELTSRWTTVGFTMSPTLTHMCQSPSYTLYILLQPRYHCHMNWSHSA